MMATSYSKPTLSRRAGRAAARIWCWLLFRNQQLRGWMVAAGMPSGVARVAGTVSLLIVVGMLFYIAFWLGIAVLATMAVVCFVGCIDALDTTEEARWRDGVAGYGLYRGEIRIDPGEQEEP
ncbi:DUF3742 family protein [Xanthomonas sp. WHRI 10064A]|uniref:DUF3742 family protein n=1 Tax=unclassified Xanthomonas TaxID=2643310 RepID=UPI002B230D60|nr:MULTISPECIES: DUF3742 family protein [unclassified Xanthomonas]MEA9585888.1 DUF3742 family protein [Xanthomonas sp. WHRI 10064B]MEA9614315.1 DUF3742 family protein [Xanthomonas sp. WHRI 10064A]